MAKTKKSLTSLPLADRLQSALVPEEKQPYPIPENWAWVKLGCIIELISGRDVPSSRCNVEGTGIPYILGASNLENNTFMVERWIQEPEVVSCRGDLLLSVKGTVGKLYLQQEEKINISRQIMAIRPKFGYDIKVLYWFFHSIDDELRTSGYGLIPGISRSDILTREFPLPPLVEQERIVARLENLLGKLDEVKERVQN
ncbi:MAG: restriction endonuclease subunit S, partial [Planctomycetia bacterium]|nr:restriction endonuclease subunit S [Planctomycetia bacterium]